MNNRDYDYVESESGGDDASDDDGDFKHAQLSLEFEHKRRNVQSEDDV